MIITSRFPGVLLRAAGGLLLGACASDVTLPPPPSASHVVVNGDVLATIPGKTATFIAHVFDASSEELPDARVAWSSSRPDVATVDNGVVTAVRPGSTRITASFGGKSQSIDFTVHETVGSITLPLPEFPLGPGTTIRVNPVFRTAAGAVTSGTYRRLAWHSSNTAVATFELGSYPHDSIQGVIVLRGSGTAIITLTALDEGVAVSVPVTVERLEFRDVRHVSAEHPKTGFWCALTTASRPYCWGPAIPGGLFAPPSPAELYAVPVPSLLPGGLRFDSLAVGSDAACGLTAAGAAYCWGYNDRGQLGAGAPQGVSYSPVAVGGSHQFRAIAGGDRRFCGIRTDDLVYCWGDNSGAQFGDGSTTSSTHPVLAVDGLHIRSISLGRDASCAISTAGAALCWGRNQSGQTGLGTTVGLTLVPTPVATGQALVRIVSGIGEHACGLTATGALYCWGRNLNGELARPTTFPHRDSLPGLAVGIPALVDVGVTMEKTCGLTAGGEVWCWGGGWNTPPTRVGFPGRAVALRVDHDRSCAVTAEGPSYCWPSPHDAWKMVPGYASGP